MASAATSRLLIGMHAACGLVQGAMAVAFTLYMRFFGKPPAAQAHG